MIDEWPILDDKDCEPGFIYGISGCEPIDSEETDLGKPFYDAIGNECFEGLPCPAEVEPESEPVVFPDNSVEFPTEEIDCELQPELCEEIPNVPLEGTEEEELPEEEELTETTEIEEIEEEESEDESGESEDEVEVEESEEESEGESEEE